MSVNALRMCRPCMVWFPDCGLTEGACRRAGPICCTRELVPVRNQCYHVAWFQAVRFVQAHPLIRQPGRSPMPGDMNVERRATASCAADCPIVATAFDPPIGPGRFRDSPPGITLTTRP